MAKKTFDYRLTVDLIIEADEKATFKDIEAVLEDMDYNFEAQPSSNAKIIRTEIVEWDNQTERTG